MRRSFVRPYGPPVSPTRLMSLVLGLAVLWMIYERSRDPATWKWFADHQGAEVVAQAATQEKAPAKKPETLVAGPTDEDEESVAALKQSLELVTDRAPIRTREMNAYWHLMGWSRAEPFAQLNQRAMRDVPFTQLWDQPDKYRGKLIHLRMHVRRVLELDAPADAPEGITKVYEIWGWTDESRSFPYVVIVPEWPEGLPTGTDIRAEIVFLGYFLKIFPYEAFEARRGAPLLIGRAEGAGGSAAKMPAKTDAWTILIVMGAVVTLLIFATLLGGLGFRKKKRIAGALPSDLTGLGVMSGPPNDDDRRNNGLLLEWSGAEQTEDVPAGSPHVDDNPSPPASIEEKLSSPAGSAAIAPASPPNEAAAANDLVPCENAR